MAHTKLLDDKANKNTYQSLHDEILLKRFYSPFSIRRHAHHSQYSIILDLIPAGSTVLDSGCGEGVLCVMLAKKGCHVTGVDLSEPNIAAARLYAAQEGVPHVTFITGDAEQLPVDDKSFDYVVSSHVLEHLPDFIRGVEELSRVARFGVIAAIPTCLNFCSLALLGGDKYWIISRRSIFAVFLGLYKVVFALFRGEEGVNEGYANHKDLVHIWRFPWVGKRLLQQGGLIVDRYCGSSYVLPYFPFLLPVSRFLLRWRWRPLLCQLGYGTTYVCRVKTYAD